MKISEEKEGVRSQDFEHAAQLRDKEQQFKARLMELKKEWEQKKVVSDQAVVTEDDIAHIVSSWTGIPVKKLAEEETERLLRMEEILHERVIGQHEAVQAVSRASGVAGRVSKTPSGRLDRLFSWGRPGWGKRSWPAAWPRHFLAMRMP